MKALLLSCCLLLFGVASAQADLYQWTDAQGVIHVVDDAGVIPESYRDKIKTFRSTKPAGTPTSLVAPGRTYPARSQGAFAQKLALDLGLIQSLREDAIGPLNGVGIQPAGGWQVKEHMIAEQVDEVVAAAQRAAVSHRITLSADGAEAIVRGVADDVLPAPVEQAATPVERYVTQEQAPTVIIQPQPSSQVIEVIREPLYVPAPVIVAPPHSHSRWHGHGGHHHRYEPPHPPQITGTPLRQGPSFAAPPPTHMPFGSSHMPFGTNRTPFGARR
jgi:hypothetical protein